MPRGKRSWTAAAVVALACALLVPASASAVQPKLSLTTKPKLFPDFHPRVRDYVVAGPCDDLRIQVRTGKATRTSVDGSRFRRGRFTVRTALAAGEAIEVLSKRARTRRLDSIRCLPADFPTWTYERNGTPAWDWYALSPALGAGGTDYVVILDKWGVPVWWFDSEGGFPRDIRVMPGPRIVWVDRGGSHYNFYDVDGKRQMRLTTVGVPLDFHDIQLLPDGNYILMSYAPRDNVDLTSIGGPADATILESVLQVVTPANDLVWEWNSSDHIAFEETGRWTAEEVNDAATGGRADLTHINAVEDAGDGYLISLRHTDALYKIAKSDGQVIWKLGGTATPESLSVIGDTAPPDTLGGQHDVRLRPNGTITAYDNQTDFPDPPRAVRYRVDEGAMTATLVEEQLDPDVGLSFCCGSARRNGTGSWVINWGGNATPNVTEFNRRGNRTWRVIFDAGFTYRAAPANRSDVTRLQLREGMNAQYPSPPTGCHLTSAATRTGGTPGPDTINGDGDPNVIVSRSGDDLVRGLAGDDCLHGQADDDRLVGQGDDDFLDGGSGADELEGGRGDDALKGRRGADLLDGEAGADRLNGGGGIDVLIGGFGGDTIRAGGGDIVRCGPGDDLVILLAGTPASISRSCETVQR